MYEKKYSSFVCYTYIGMTEENLTALLRHSEVFHRLWIMICLNDLL